MTDVHMPPADQAARDTIRDDHGQTLFVEAGAGTGKTTALVARVVEMVASGHLVEMAGLAAITFTENAAAELRNRIREALEQAAQGEHNGRSYDAAQAERCASALRQLDDAAITTLHGFAARILSDVPIEAGLPPGFTVTDAITAELAAARAWRAFVDDLLDDDRVTEHLLAGLTLDLKLDRLRDVAREFAANWDQLTSRPFSHVAMPPIDVTRIVDALREAAAFASVGPAGDKLTLHLRQDIEPAVDELSTASDSLDALEAVHRLQLKPGSGNATAWSSARANKAEVVAVLQAAAAARTALLGAVSVAVTETLCARVCEFTLAQAEQRRREGRLDFHDLLVLTRDVLRSDVDVRRRLHTRYPALMIDEFQDTDPLQVEIACLIAGDCEEEPADRWDGIALPAGRLFFVGDPKQSIYRFRRADVTLFTAVSEAHRGGHTRLDVNFRSVPGILDAVNTVFAELIGQSAAQQVGYADLVAHRSALGESPPAMLLGGPHGGNAAELREREANHIAAAIARVKADHWPVSRDGSSTRSTDASYGDVAILLPARTSLPSIETALQQRDIPYRVESRSLVWATDAVRDVVTLLQGVANPADEVATVAALRHHGLACSDTHLVEWHSAGGRWNFLSPKPPDAISLDHPVAAGMASLRQWHELRWWLPVNQLVDRIVRDLRLVELTAELHRPRDHWRRLRFVVDQARAFCDAGGTGLSDFVAWAVDQIESEADVLETVVPEPDDDAVRILTVHGAKGLEFPVTIVAGLGVGPRSGAEVLWGGDRPEVRLKSGTLQTARYDDQNAVDKAASQAEAVRLLYVAMTRAKDHLLLGCYHKVTSGTPSHAQELRRLLASDSSLVMVESDAPPVATQAAAASHAPNEVDRTASLSERAALIAAVASRVATSPTAMVGVTAPAGESVKSDEADVDPPEPAESDGDVIPRRRRAGTGAAIGTAVHRVLELVSMDPADDDEIRRLADVACAQEEITTLVDDVVKRVKTALRSSTVRDAIRGRFWREVYVVSPDDQRFVEGYIDLLAERDDGSHVVVDYKTDRIDNDDERAAKELHYAPQLAAYVGALARAGMEGDVSARLVFTDAEDAG